MALADYFPRDAVAISQILQGFQRDDFIEHLKNIRVAVAFGEEAGSSRDGRHLLEFIIRLVARLYPSLTFNTVPAGDYFAAELMTLAVRINPNIELGKASTAQFGISIGADAPCIDNTPTVYAGCDGWVARVGTASRYNTSDLGNPFGAGFAACLAAANLFRGLFLPNGIGQLDLDTSFPSDTASFPHLADCTLARPLVLVGTGAVGNSAAWALAHSPLAGELHLVDPEAVELANLQRYVLCARSDEGGAKVDIVGHEFQGPLRVLRHHGTWASFVAANGYTWERVLVALDSAHDRRAVQASLPCWIANAWTQEGDLGVSTHSFLGEHTCLACLYLPTQTSKNEDQVVAEGLRVPHLQDRVRFFLGSGQPTDQQFCDAVATAWGIPTEALAPYVGMAIRDLWVEGICGGGIIPLGENPALPRENQVPLAFQSAFAGILLAAEAVRDVLTDGVERTPSVRRLDILRPMGNRDSSPQAARKAGTGRCICEDCDFIAAYRTKYNAEPAVSRQEVTSP